MQIKMNVKLQQYFISYNNNVIPKSPNIIQFNVESFPQTQLNRQSELISKPTMVALEHGNSKEVAFRSSLMTSYARKLIIIIIIAYGQVNVNKNVAQHMIDLI